ncbi:MAG: hypothetical protein HYW34_03180 [Candidatus Brennerbacteria bacterium]|nr:hypothetical protein [Candidatus Brennerbacteria bacterium]
MEKLKMETWPSGITTISGGNRTTIKLSRPWQKDIEMNPKTCPFCTRKQKVLDEYKNDKGEKWQLIQNLYTPFPYHKMVIPRLCGEENKWPKEEIRRLGGIARIKKALQIASIELNSQDALNRFIQLQIHVGPYAGQTIGHLHYHFLEQVPQPKPLATLMNLGIYAVENPASEIFESDNWTINVGGERAGQCYIIPKEKPVDFDTTAIEEMANLIASLIHIYEKSFTSEQGLAPDYMIVIRFMERKICYGTYVPILNQWGGTEYMGLTEGTSIVLPWPHEETAKYIKGGK